MKSIFEEWKCFVFILWRFIDIKVHPHGCPALFLKKKSASMWMQKREGCSKSY
jgi:hypothetical protein